MTSIFSPASSIVAAAVAASVIIPVPCSAGDGPRLVEKALHTSDIQYRFTRSPGNKGMSVKFDNFAVALVPDSGAAPAIRLLPLRMPVGDAGNGATLRVQAKGGLSCPAGTACAAILWVNGHTRVLKLPRGKAPGNFLAEAEFSLPGADVHQAAVILIADRETRPKRFLRKNVAASIRIDSLDLTLAPPVEAAATKK